jgi:hypothetical protein
MASFGSIASMNVSNSLNFTLFFSEGLFHVGRALILSRICNSGQRLCLVVREWSSAFADLGGLFGLEWQGISMELESYCREDVVGVPR